jgi:hypothetical protein
MTEDVATLLARATFPSSCTMAGMTTRCGLRMSSRTHEIFLARMCAVLQTAITSPTTISPWSLATSGGWVANHSYSASRFAVNVLAPGDPGPDVNRET